MKKRTIPALIMLSIVTLGFYELYWLLKTRNEMVNKFRLSIPSAWWLIALKAAQIGCVLFTAYVVLYEIPVNNRRIDNLVRPSAECFIEYTQSSDHVRADGKSTVSQDCKNQVNSYYQTDNTTRLLLIISGLYVFSFVLLWLVLKRWFVPYAEAVANITRPKLSSTYAMILLVVVPSPFGMLAIQDAYNKS